MPAPRPRALDDAGEHVQVRVADGVLRRPPLQPAVARGRSRQQQQAEQEQGGGEAQLGPFAQTAWICTSTRTFCGPRDPGAHVDDDASAGAARCRAHRAEGGERGRPRACGTRRRVENDEHALAGEARVREPLALPVLQPDVLDAADRRVDRRRDGLQLPRRLVAPCGCGLLRRSPGMQPSSGRKPESARVVCATKTAARPVVTPGPTGPPRLPRNVIPSGPARSASRPPITWPRPGTRELVVGRRRRCRRPAPTARRRGCRRSGRRTPVPASARRRRHAGDGCAEDEHGKQSLDHGSLPKRKAETAPAASRSNAPPAAKPAVISRSSLTLPIREPSSS